MNPVVFIIMFARIRLKLYRLVARLHTLNSHLSFTLNILSIQHDLTSTSRSLTSVGSTPGTALDNLIRTSHHTRSHQEGQACLVYGPAEDCSGS
jgi:hypothetical protein